MKPGDDNAIPLCSGGHRELHDIGEPRFSAKYGVDLTAIAGKLWRTSPHRKKDEAQ